jgi:hypothetical protein
MAFTVPVFNVTANVWHDGSDVSGAPDIISVCQLYLNTRGSHDLDRFDDFFSDPPFWGRFPVGTALRNLDTMEIAAGSTWFYHCRLVDRVHLGFPNEYVGALLSQLWTPLGGGEHIPMPGTFGFLDENFPPGFLVLESGSFLLLE